MVFSPGIAAASVTTRRVDQPRRRWKSSVRRNAILDAALVAASVGGYDAVRMRTVADHAGIATGTLYRYFPSKTHLLVSALIRELSRLEEWCDWSTIGSDAEQRLASLTARLHVEWQRNPLLTEAMTRAFVVADASACAEVDRATDVIERLLANALGGVNPSPRDMQVAGLLGDVWLANLTAFIGNRLSAREAQGSMDRTARLLLNRHHARIATERY